MAHATDTLYEQGFRGQAAQAAGCFERKMLSDPNPKEEIALAMLTRSLVVAKSSALAQRDALKNYTEDNVVTASDDTSPIDKEITSALARKKSKNDGDGKQSIIDECIPCLDRTLDVDLMAPLEDLLDDLEFDIEDKWNTLREIWDLLNSDDFYADICELIDFFSFQCLPDLVAILSLLLWMWKSLLESFSVDINGALWSLLGMMMGPFLTGLESTIQQYIDLIMAPIDCIISALLFQMSKIPQFEADAAWLDERQQEMKVLETRELEGAIGGQFDSATVSINAAIINQLNFTALKATSWDQSKEYYQTQTAKTEEEKYQYGKKTGEGPVGATTPITVEDEETIAAETGGEPGSPEEEARLERKAYIEEREARERSKATTADWLLDAANTLESGLGQVGSYLIAGRDRMLSWLASIRDDLRAFLFGTGSGFTNAVELTQTISRLARLIGFVKALIKMAEDGFDCGSDRDLSEPDMINFLQNYYAPESGAAVIIGDDGDVTILPPGTGDTRITAISAPEGAVTEAQAGVTISIPNCLNRSDATDLRKVEEWIKQISQ